MNPLALPSFRFLPLAFGMTGMMVTSIASAETVDATRLTPIALRAHTAGTFYLPTTLGSGLATEALVDTGSSFLVVGEAQMAALVERGEAHAARKIDGGMADGSRRVVPLYRLDRLRLGEHCELRDVEAAVLPGNARPILGMNVLAQLAPLTFTLDPPQLLLHRCEPSAQLQEVTDTKKPAAVLADAGLP